MPLYKGTDLAKAVRYNIPTRYEDAIRAGIRFWAVVYPEKRTSGFPERMFGVFDVSVNEHVAQSGSSFMEKWNAGRGCCVQYELQDRRGTMIAFVPDDRFYHNKVQMAMIDLYKNNILEMHTGIGTAIPGSVARMELDCLYEVLTEDVVRFAVRDKNNRIIDTFDTREEADEFRNTEESKTKHGIPIGGVYQPYKSCEIIEKSERQVSNYIKGLQAKYDGIPYGWTNPEINTEFKVNVIDRVEDMVSNRLKRMENDEPKTIVDMDVDRIVDEKLSRLLGTDDPSEILELIKLKAQKASSQNIVVDSDSDIEEPGETDLVVGPDEKVEEYNAADRRRELLPKKDAELNDICAEYGIEGKGLQRLTKIKYIIEYEQAQYSETQEEIT